MSLTKLEADMNVISNLSIPLFSEDVETIQKLSDEPNDVDGLTAAELKAKFDKAGVLIKEYLNETLVPQLSDTVAEADVRAAAEQERVDNENLRADNETARIDAENERAQNEKDRSSAEAQRVLAETKRVSAEAARQRAEEARVDTTNGIVAQATEKAEEAGESAAAAAESAKNAEEYADNIGAHGKEVSATLLASGWSGSGPYVQIVTVFGVNGNSFGNIGIPVSATDDQRAAAKDARMYLSAVDTNVVAITAEGEKPAIDIPIVVQFGMVIDGNTGSASGGDGKSAYQYAVEGGYTGTEEAFAAKLAAESPTVDDTLTQSGQAADAAAVGEQLSNLSEEKVNLPKAEDGSAIPGTAGWYAVSDGAGGITWVESAPSTGGGGETTTHGIIWDLVNVTSSNNAVSVADGASLVAVLTPTDGYALGDVTITMGGEVVTGAWNADTATIAIANVTGDVMISCAGVEQGASGSADTSPRIQAYDTGWDGNGVATQTLTGTIANTTGLCILEPYELTLDVDALRASSKYDAANDYLTAAGSAVRICVYTPFTNYRAKAYGYSSMTNVTKNVYFADGNCLNTGSNASYNTDSPTVLTFGENRYLTAVLTASKLSFSCTLSTDDLDDSYAYFTSTLSGVMPVGVREGDIIFAGKNTPYYGMANIDGTMLGGEAATALSLDDDIAQDYGVATLSLTPDLSADTSTTYGLASAYASALETIRDEWMIEYNGNANKIPIIIHTDQHGRMTNGGNVKGLFNTIGKAFSLHDISKIMNLGDTVSVEWEDADTDHPLLSCTALENYLSTVEAIPFSKRLEVFGNHDTWYYNGYHDEGNAVGTRYPSTQNHLYKYFRNIYKKSNGNNTGYFAVCDDYFNVKYVIVSAYEYQNGTISDRMTSEQIEWIIREFSKDDGYDIVVVSHCPLYWDDTTGTFPEGAPTTTETLRIADDWIDALWAGRKNKTSGTVNDSDGGSHTFDFTGCTSNLLCALHGHTHRAGYNYVSDSLLSVAFDWFEHESMYFCLIDRENRELKVWKFIGSDSDAPEYLTWVAPFDKQ